MLRVIVAVLVLAQVACASDRAPDTQANLGVPRVCRPFHKSSASGPHQVQSSEDAFIKAAVVLTVYAVLGTACLIAQGPDLFTPGQGAASSRSPPLPVGL